MSRPPYLTQERPRSALAYKPMPIYLINHLIEFFSQEKQQRFLYVVNLQNPIRNITEQYARLNVSLHIDSGFAVVAVVAAMVLRVVLTVVSIASVVRRTCWPAVRCSVLKCFVIGAAITVSAAAKPSVVLSLSFTAPGFEVFASDFDVWL